MPTTGSCCTGPSAESSDCEDSSIWPSSSEPDIDSCSLIGGLRLVLPLALTLTLPLPAGTDAPGVVGETGLDPMLM